MSECGVNERLAKLPGELTGMHLGVEHFQKILRDGNLHKPSAVCVNVAGTNGKGSTVAYLSQMLQNSGKSVGTFISPHLMHFNERICINGTMVTDKDLQRAFATVDEFVPLEISYFEYALASALWLFKEKQLDVIILEVGLGGRLDAVNAIDPDCCIITAIDIDHKAHLGSTRELIAKEKAGILRDRVPLVVSEHAMTNSMHYAIEQHHIDAKVIKSNGISPFADSFALAREAYQRLRESTGLKLSDLNSEEIFDLPLKGRFQIQKAPCLQVWDVAHNPHGAKWLKTQLEKQFPNKRFVALWSSFKDKDISGICAPFNEMMSRWFIAPSTSERSASNETLGTALQNQGIKSIKAFDSLATAYTNAVDSITDEVLVVFGSFSTVQEIMHTHQHGYGS